MIYQFKIYLTRWYMSIRFSCCVIFLEVPLLFNFKEQEYYKHHVVTMECATWLTDLKRSRNYYFSQIMKLCKYSDLCKFLLITNMKSHLLVTSVGPLKTECVIKTLPGESFFILSQETLENSVCACASHFGHKS